MRKAGRHTISTTSTGRIVSFVVYSLVALILMTGASLASYRSAANSDVEVSSRITNFEVETSHDDNWSEHEYADAISLDYGETHDYPFTAVNKSEVAVRARLVDADTDEIYTDWVYLHAGEEKVLHLIVTGDYHGNEYKVHIEYEQVG